MYCVIYSVDLSLMKLMGCVFNDLWWWNICFVANPKIPRQFEQFVATSSNSLEPLWNKCDVLGTDNFICCARSTQHTRLTMVFASSNICTLPVFFSVVLPKFFEKNEKNNKTFCNDVIVKMRTCYTNRDKQWQTIIRFMNLYQMVFSHNLLGRFRFIFVTLPFSLSLSGCVCVLYKWRLPYLKCTCGVMVIKYILHATKFCDVIRRDFFNLTLFICECGIDNKMEKKRRKMNIRTLLNLWCRINWQRKLQMKCRRLVRYALTLFRMVMRRGCKQLFCAHNMSNLVQHQN